MRLLCFVFQRPINYSHRPGLLRDGLDAIESYFGDLVNRA